MIGARLHQRKRAGCTVTWSQCRCDRIDRLIGNLTALLLFRLLERKKKEQVAQLESLKNREETMIFYESPYRLKELLKNIATVMGAERQVVICRELTKRF